MLLYDGILLINDDWKQWIINCRLSSWWTILDAAVQCIIDDWDWWIDVDAAVWCIIMDELINVKWWCIIVDGAANGKL